MRSFLVILTTFCLLGGAFFVYTQWAAPPARAVDDAVHIVAAVPPPAQDAVGSMGEGNGAWMNLYDRNTGYFYARLRAREYTPMPDHSYHVTSPEAEFYQPNGQIIHLTGVDGDVALDDQTQHNSLAGGPVDPPKQGTLRDVTVKIYADQAALERDQPDLTMHTDNARFDADTYRLFTIRQQNPITGQTVPADQVPVTLRGKDLDFDGWGLVVYWNDERHELKSLLVPHGRRLRLKNQTAFTPNAAAPPPSVQRPAPIVAVPPVALTSIAPAEEQPSPAPDATVQPSTTHVYKATFTGQVRVVQNGQDRVAADEMEVTLATGSDRGTSSSAPLQPPPSPAASPAPASAAEPKESVSNPAPLAPRSPAPDAPVDIFWTGPLKVVPAPPTADSLKPGQEIVHFIGSPVHIRQDGLEMIGQRARYISSTGAARMFGEPGNPVRMTLLNRQGTTAGTIIADRVEYLQARHLATFGGVGTADFPDPSKPGEFVRATWDKQCDVTLAGTGEQLQVSRADLQGNAFVSDGSAGTKPKLRLTAQRIVTDFDHAATTKSKGQPAQSIRQVVAVGDADCLIHDEKGQDKSITTDKLTIVTGKDSGGQPYPRFITGQGNVHAQQEQQELWSQKLYATVGPIVGPTGLPSRGSGEARYQLQTLLATGDVRAKNDKDGNTAAGQALSIEEMNGKPVITLVGNPAAGDDRTDMATVSGPDGVLWGREIDAKPKDQWAAVAGAGAMDCVRAPEGRAEAKEKQSQPMHVRWDKSAQLLGDQDRMEVVGHVVADTTEASGAVNTANSGRAVLLLMPSAAAHPKARSTSSSGGSPLADAKFDLLKDKQVKQVTLLDNAEVMSLLSASDGSILRRSYLNGQRIDAYLPEQRMVVPGAGRMLLEDHGKTDAKTQAAPDQPQTGGYGITGFWWKNRFTFDQLAHQAVIEGSVMISHLPDGTHATLTQVWADTVIADFEPSAVASASSQQQPKLKDLRAQDNVHIVTPTQIIDAVNVSYDPNTEVLIATGSPEQRVRVSDRQNRGEAVFQEVWIDTRLNQIIKMVDFTGAAR
jgi:hypothetical protein